LPFNLRNCKYTYMKKPLHYWIYLIKIRVRTVIFKIVKMDFNFNLFCCNFVSKWYIHIFLNEFNSVIAKLNFQQHYSSVSHGTSEMIIICWFSAQETVVLLNISLEVLLKQYFWILWESSKEQLLFETEIFYNIAVFTVTFDQFNALQNTIMN